MQRLKELARQEVEQERSDRQHLATSLTGEAYAHFVTCTRAMVRPVTGDSVLDQSAAKKRNFLSGFLDKVRHEQESYLEAKHMGNIVKAIVVHLGIAEKEAAVGQHGYIIRYFPELQHSCW